MTRPLLLLLAAALTLAGLWALASKPAAAYLLSGLDDDPHDWADYDAEDIA